MALRGRMSLAGYDRLFPSQDVLPEAGVGNLIAAPLQGRLRKDGATVFLDLATMEPHQDQCAYLSTLSWMSPAEVSRLARHAGTVLVGTKVDQCRVHVESAVLRASAATPLYLGQAAVHPQL